MHIYLRKHSRYCFSKFYLLWYFADAHTTAQTSARLACSLLFKRFFEIFFNPLVKIKLLSYNTYATEKNNSTKRISRQVGIR